MFNTPDLAEVFVGQSDFLSTSTWAFSSYRSSVRVAAKQIEVVSVSFDWSVCVEFDLLSHNGW